VLQWLLQCLPSSKSTIRMLMIRINKMQYFFPCLRSTQGVRLVRLASPLYKVPIHSSRLRFSEGCPSIAKLVPESSCSWKSTLFFFCHVTCHLLYCASHTVCCVFVCAVIYRMSGLRSLVSRTKERSLLYDSLTESM